MARTRGRTPTPIERRELEGNPGRRPLPATPPASLPSRIPRAPSYLRGPGRSAWRRAWKAGRAWLAESDYETVARWCRLIDRTYDLEARIDADGFIHDGPASERTDPVSGETIRAHRGSIHHSFNNALALYKAMAELESALGFRPTDRARLRVEPDAADDLTTWESKRPTPLRAVRGTSDTEASDDDD